LRDLFFFCATSPVIRKTHFYSRDSKSKIFFLSATTFGFSLRSDRQLRTTYGRTSTREWKVLRDTDGERFVLQNKVSTFSGEFVRCEKRKSSRTDIFDD
jgi:uncharacterized secreted protein with C-terminal beta-propeller domain